MKEGKRAWIFQVKMATRTFVDFIKDLYVTMQNTKSSEIINKNCCFNKLDIVDIVHPPLFPFLLPSYICYFQARRIQLSLKDILFVFCMRWSSTPATLKCKNCILFGLWYATNKSSFLIWNSTFRNADIGALNCKMVRCKFLL